MVICKMYKCTKCEKSLDNEGRADLIDVCYQCATKGKSLHKYIYHTNLSFTPKLNKDGKLPTVENK